MPDIEGPDLRDEARRLIVSSEGMLAEYLEQDPDNVVKADPLMEKLDIARRLLEDGELELALRNAREADAAARKLKPAESPPEDRTEAVRKCTDCGEPLEAGWVACPKCGNKQ